MREDDGVHIRAKNGVIIFRLHTGTFSRTEKPAIKQAVRQKEDGALEGLLSFQAPARWLDAMRARLATILTTSEAQDCHLPVRAAAQQRGGLTRNHLRAAVIVLIKK